MRLLLIILTLATVMSGAYAQTAPPFQPARHVYVVPDGWSHPLMGQAAIQRIEESAAARKYPFYVVVGPRDAVPDVNQIATAWGGAGFNNHDGTIFTLRFGKKLDTQLLVGGRWEEELGLKGDAGHKPFMDVFAAAVRTKRKDITGGTISMIEKLDTYLQEEPARRQAAAEEQRRALASQRLTEARMKLHGLTLQLSRLLSERQYLPANVDEERAALRRAEAFLESDAANDPVNLDGMSAALAPVVQKLDGKVSSEKDKETLNAVAKGVGIFFALLITFLLLRFLNARHNRMIEFRDRYSTKLNKYLEMVDTGMGRYVDFRDRDDLIRLQKAMETEPDGNRTKVLVKEVTRAVDDIFLALKALQSYLLNRVRPVGNKGGFFNLGAFIEAENMIEMPFDFDTGEIEERDLFSAETRTIKVAAADFARQQSEKYAAAVAGWKKLKDALAMQSRPVSSAIDVEDFHEWLREAKIALTWFSLHPLSPSAVAGTMATLEGLRVHDPVMYVEAVGVTLARASKVETLAERVQAVAKEAEKVVQISWPTETILSEEEDPDRTLQTLNRERTRLKVMLASYSPPSKTFDDAFPDMLRTVEDLERRAKEIADLRLKATRQAAEISEAVSNSMEMVGHLSLALSEAGRAGERAAARQAEAAKVHANAPSLETAQNNAQLAAKLAGDATAALKARKHMEAARIASQAKNAATRAKDMFQAVIVRCEELDAKKAAYERRVKEMPSFHAQVSHRVSTQYKARRTVPAFSADRHHCHHDCPVDYTLMMAEVEAERRAMEEAEEAAKREHMRESMHSSRSSSYSSRRDDEDTSSRGSYSTSSRDEDTSSRGSYSIDSGSCGGGGGTESNGSFDL